MAAAKLSREKAIAYILGEVAGGRSLVRVLREDKGVPGSSTFWRWHMEDENLRENLARARENGVEALMEEAREIADTQEIGEIVTVDGDKETVRKEDMLGHRKLRIETRLKYAQMIAPRKYGPKLDLTSGNEPIKMDDTAVAARAAALLKMGLDRAGSD